MAQKMQTVIFSKQESPSDINGGGGWTESTAKTWLEAHDFSSDKVDETDQSLRAQVGVELNALTEYFPAGVSAAACEVPESTEKPSAARHFVDYQVVDLASELFNKPLLIERSRFDALQMLGAKDGAIDPSAFFFLFENPRNDDLRVRDGIAIIDVKGPLFGFKLARIGRQLDRAVADESIRGIFLDVNSPGGRVAGTFDLADRIFEARQAKPIRSVANDDAFSGAFALASATQRVSVTRTGGVGSVGVIATHVEFSKMDERIGVKITEIFSGARKNDLSDAKPLNREGRALLQMEVDRLREIFVETVARNRGLSADNVRDTEAAPFFGPEGLSIGFVDAVESFDEAFEAFRASFETRAAVPAVAQQEKPMSEIVKDPRGNVINLDEMRAEAQAKGKEEGRAEGEQAARDAETKRRADISQLCTIAGCPDRLGEFLESDMTAEQVGKKLLDERAEKTGQEEIDGTHTVPTTGTQPRIDHAAIYQSRHEAH